MSTGKRKAEAILFCDKLRWMVRQVANKRLGKHSRQTVEHGVIHLTTVLSGADPKKNWKKRDG